MKKMWKALALSFIGAGAGLMLYCGNFYVKSFLENKRMERQYEKIREICQEEKAVDSPKKSERKSKIRKKQGEIKESFGISWEKLKKVNTDVRGWISVPGADISYPIVQGVDDEFYLAHSLEGEKSPFGSIFLGCGHKGDFFDSHNLIYGHNMEGNMMFANLNRYEDYNFWQQCPEFVVTIPERQLVYDIFSVEQAREGSMAFVYGYEKGSGEYEEQLKVLRENSLYETGIFPSGQQNIVTLVTCNSRLEADVRMTIHGVLRYSREYEDE